MSRRTLVRNMIQGWPAAILGSGPSLPLDLVGLPSSAILISVNVRPAKLVTPDCVVFMDRSVAGPAAELGVMRISQIASASDVDLPAGWWDGGFSASLATWVACWWGCDPILLCGMGCFRGGQSYFDEEGRTHPGDEHDKPLENHLRAWRPAIDRCPGSQAIKAMSGPLGGIFGYWEG